MTVLADLKHLLLEAGQQLPLFLKELGGDEDEKQETTETGDEGCSYCSGLGHRITNCPRLEAMKTKTFTNLMRPTDQGGL